MRDPTGTGQDGKAAPVGVCFWSIFDGYQAEFAFGGQPWLKLPSDLGRVAKAPPQMTQIALTPSDTDLVGR